MEVMFWVAVSIFILYMLTTYSLFGKTGGISSTVYKWRDLDSPLTWIFTIFCWGVSIPIIIYWVDYNTHDWDFLPFIAGAALAFVGASPFFRDDGLEQKVHKIVAITCISASYLWALAYGNPLLTLISITLFLLLYFFTDKKYIAYWVEIAAFSNLFTQLKL